MPTIEAPNEYAASLRDAVLDRSALTEDMLDDEAKVYIDWAMTQADRVGLLVENEDDAEARRDAFMGWLKSLSRLVTLRKERDAAWFAETLAELDAQGQATGLPPLSEEHKVALSNHVDKSNVALLEHFISTMTPVSSSPAAPEQVAPEPPAETSHSLLGTLQEKFQSLLGGEGKAADSEDCST